MADIYFGVGINDQTKSKLDAIITNIKNAGIEASKTSQTITSTVASAYSSAVKKSLITGKNIKDSLMDSYKQLVKESATIGEEIQQQIESALNNPLDTSGINATIDSLKAKLVELQDNNTGTPEYNTAINELSSSIGILEGAVQMADKSYTDINKRMDENRKLMVEMKLQGQENTAEYKTLVDENAQLQKALDETNASLNQMKEGGVGLSTVVGAFQTITGVMSTFAGVASLCGSSTEEVAQQQQKLQSIMAVAVGVQSLYNSLQTKSTLLSGVYALKASAAAKATQLQTKATKSATIAQKALNIVANANPYVLLATAVASLAGVYALLKARTKTLSKDLQSVAKALSSATASASTETQHLQKLFSALASATQGTEEYEKIKSTIVKQYGSYLPNLAQEISDVNNLKGCYDKLADSIEKSYKQKAFFEGMKEAQEEYTKTTTKNLQQIHEELVNTYGEQEGTRLMEQFNKALAKNQVSTNTQTVKQTRVGHYGEIQEFETQQVQLQIEGVSDEDLKKLQNVRSEIFNINKAKEQLSKTEDTMRSYLGVDITEVENETTQATEAIKDYKSALEAIYKQIATDTLNIQKQQTKDKIKQLQLDRQQSLNALEEEKKAFKKEYGDDAFNAQDTQKAFKQKEYVINLQYNTNLLQVKEELNKFIKDITSQDLTSDFKNVQLDSREAEINDQLDNNLVPLQKRMDLMKELLEIDKERLKIAYEQSLQDSQSEQTQKVQEANNMGASIDDINKINEQYEQERLLLAQTYEQQQQQLELQSTHNILNEKLQAYEQYVTQKYEAEEAYEQKLAELQEQYENGEISQEQYNTGVQGAGAEKDMTLNEVAMNTLGEMDSAFEETIAGLVGDVMQMSLEELANYIPQLQAELEQLKADGKDTSSVQVKMTTAQKRLNTLQTKFNSKGSSGTKKLTTRMKAFTLAVEAAQEALDVMVEIFGDDMSTASKQLVSDTSELLSGVMALGEGISAAAEGVADAERSSVILTIISAALAVLNATIKVFQTLLKSDQLNAQDMIEDNEKAVKRLSTSLKLLQAQQNSQTGTKYWQTQYSAIVNLNKQVELYRKNMQTANEQMNKAKKKKDKNKWEEEYQTQVDNYTSALQELQDAQDELIEGLTGLNFDSFTQSLAESIIEGFENGLDGGLDAWDDAVDDMIKTMLQTQLQTQLQDQLQSVIKKFTSKLGSNKTKITEEEYFQLQKELENAKAGATETIKEYQKLFDELGLNQEETVEGSEGAFESMSQDTADELNARFTALQIEGSNLVVGQGKQTEALLATQAGIVALCGTLTEMPDFLRLFNSGITKIQDLSQTQADRLLIIANNTNTMVNYTRYIKDIYESI